jgi:hypothetical protein
MPASVGRPPERCGSNTNVMPVAPSPKYVCPPLPDPSITPSSPSTESVMPLGVTNEPLPETPSALSVSSSNVSMQSPDVPAVNGLSAALRYGIGPTNVARSEPA